MLRRPPWRNFPTLNPELELIVFISRKMEKQTAVHNIEKTAIAK